MVKDTIQSKYGQTVMQAGDYICLLQVPINRNSPTGEEIKGSGHRACKGNKRQSMKIAGLAH